MDMILFKMAVVCWFIAGCIESQFRGGFTYAAKEVFWPVKTVFYVVAFVSTIILIVTW